MKQTILSAVKLSGIVTGPLLIFISIFFLIFNKAFITNSPECVSYFLTIAIFSGVINLIVGIEKFIEMP